MTTQQLERLRPAFIQEIDRQAAIYKLIGSGISESPIWIQYARVTTYGLCFVNSQRPGICFEIPADEHGANFSEVYDYFKRAKYDHIRSHYPELWEEMRSEAPSQFNAVNQFLNQ